MEIEQIREKLKMQLKNTRYLHSEGVEEVAVDLAVIYGYDMERAKLAGLLHDCAKYLTDEELLAECEKHNLPVSEVERKCAFLLHAKVGAFYARTKYGVADDEILDSITFHTTGRPGMTLLEKIIFTADYIEPYRRPLPRINEIRSAAYSELDQAVLMILDNTLRYLKECSAEIDTLTDDTYHYYKTMLQG
jgi:nicotinate-nucleotide adenylyltransferase